jgi:uncharacterized protein (TIGR02246 family)
MSDEDDKQKIREVISTWMRASANGDTERLLSLMAKDVVFLVPGRPPDARSSRIRSRLQQFRWQDALRRQV